MKELDLDVTNLVENRGSKVFISKEVLLNFLKETYYPFDIELEGLLCQSDINEWVSPDKTYNFEATHCNDHDCGNPCVDRLRFECGSISDTEFCFSASQRIKDPYNDDYEMMTLLSDHIERNLPESGFKEIPSEDFKNLLNFEVSKLHFKEFRSAVICAIHDHLKKYYWCDEYTDRGFYCPHILEEDQV